MMNTRLQLCHVFPTRESSFVTGLILSLACVGCSGTGGEARVLQTSTARHTMSAESDESHVPDSSPAIRILTQVIEDNNAPADARERARIALARGKETETSSPFLIRAMLYDPPLGESAVILDPIAVDKPGDLCGVTIREERTKTDGTTVILEEDYPVYARQLTAPYEAETWVWAHIRTGDQRKDTRAWEESLIDTIDWFIYKFLQRQQDHRSYGLGMPPVWVSTPEPGKVRVFVSVYDRQRHHSNLVELENLRGPENLLTALRYMRPPYAK